MKISHKITNISGRDVVYIYVTVEDIYEFGKENLGKGENTDFLTKLREYITNNLNIPTIGIGAGVGCDGQIVVTDDILGKFTDFAPKFVKRFANLHDTVLNGVMEYSTEVKNGLFPSEKESFILKIEEREKLNAIK